MSNKKVTFGSRPTTEVERPATLAEWAGDDADRRKRITFDVSPELHGRIKAACALRGISIKEFAAELLERECPKER
jgi:predicted DNA binding CopG/RHH family protein